LIRSRIRGLGLGGSTLGPMMTVTRREGTMATRRDARLRALRCFRYCTVTCAGVVVPTRKHRATYTALHTCPDCKYPPLFPRPARPSRRPPPASPRLPCRTPSRPSPAHSPLPTPRRMRKAANHAPERERQVHEPLHHELAGIGAGDGGALATRQRRNGPARTGHVGIEGG